MRLAARDGKNIPFFVYGTLLSGFNNHKLVASRIQKIVPASITGVQLAHFTEGFPGIYPARNKAVATVQGELLFPQGGEEESVLEILDKLEGYFGEGDARNEYERKMVLAQPNDGRSAAVQAQAYFCLRVDEWGGIPVQEGDWRRYMTDGDGVIKPHSGEEWSPNS